MKNNRISLALLVLWVAGTLGCDAKAPSTSTTATEKPRIALVMKSLSNEFFTTMAEGAKSHQQANRETYELIVNGIKDERDISRQAAIVDEMTAMKVDAIVIAPADSKALVSALARAKKAGIVVVNIDNPLDAEILAQQQVQIPFVGPNNRKGAALVGEHLASMLKPGDSVAILEGIRTSENAKQRKLGFEDAIAVHQWRLVSSQSAEWEMSQANNLASSILREFPETKAILAANDNMALGALAAVKALSKSESVKVVGFDNISAVQQAIRDGGIAATAEQHGDQLAVFGIDFALKSLQATDAPIENIETPVDLITAKSLR